MSVSSSAAARGIPLTGDDRVPTAATWTWRFLVTLLVMTVWLAITLAATAYVLPTDVNPNSLKPRDGVFCSFPINIYLGLLTAVYYASILPTLLLPIRDEERFIWFLHIAFGWMVLLLGSVGLLALFGQLQVEAIKVPFEPNWRQLSAVLAAIFLVPMALSLGLPVDGRRRVTCLVSLLVGWAIFQGGVLGYVYYLHSLSLDPDAIETGVPKLAFLFLSVLYVVLVAPLTLPETPRMRTELLAFLLLLWCFTLAGDLCFYVMKGQISLAKSLAQPTFGPFRRWLLFQVDPGGSISPTALVQFGCLVLTMWLAPFLGWLAMPWVRRTRRQWALCLVLAAVVILRYLQQTPFSEREPLLVHVLTNYNGPHLLPVDFARH